MRTQLIFTILVLVSTIHGVALCDGTLFEPPVMYEVGDVPQAIAAGDFNEDGDLDLALPMRHNHYNDYIVARNIVLLLGGVDGTFERTEPADSGGNYAVGIVTADFDKDGHADLAVTNQQDDTVTILKGHGDGTFEPFQPPIPTGGRYPRGIITGDFNRDKRADLVVLHLYNPMSLLLGNGNGTFQNALTYSVAADFLRDVATDDFNVNEDGYRDVAVIGMWSRNVVVILGNGDGTFRSGVSYAVGAQPQCVMARDLDGDGDSDLAVTNYDSNNVSILLNNGNGSFQSAVPYGAGNGAYGLGAGDFNGDGKIDLAVGNELSENVSVLLGIGGGIFQSALNYAVVDPQELITGDFDGDLRTDLAIPNERIGKVSMLLSTLPDNSSPTANAGPDVTIHWTAQAVTLITGQAFDPDPGTALTYRWVDASDVTLLDWGPVGSAGEAPLSLGPLGAFPIGATTLYLEVSDGLVTTRDEMILTVTNSAPIANAGDNVMIATEQQSSTVLAAAASDADGDTLTYQWLDVTDGEPVPLLDRRPVNDDTSAPLALGALQSPLSMGQHRLRLEVSDGVEVTSDTMVLTIANSPPDVAITGGGTYQQWDPITVGGSIGDFDGDVVCWEILEGSTVHASGQLQTIAGGQPVDIPDVDLTGMLSGGTHELSLRAFDGVNTVISEPCSVTVILDEESPRLSPQPSVRQLWPPNHVLVPVTIAVNAQDNSPVPIHLDVSVICDEPINAVGDGNTEPDWIIDGVEDGPGGFVYLRLRAERQGKGDGRTYTITIVATDAYGNSSSAQVQIVAPHDRGRRN